MDEEERYKRAKARVDELKEFYEHLIIYIGVNITLVIITQREKRHSKMFEPKFTISNSITKALLEIERARGFLDAANLTP